MAGIKLEHTLNPQQLKKLVDCADRLTKRLDLMTQQLEELAAAVELAVMRAGEEPADDVGRSQEAPAEPVAAPSAAGDTQPA